MKLPLTNDIISNLDFLHLPIGLTGKKNNILVTNPEVNKKTYIVFDSNSNSPSGFGIRVGKESKTFVLQARIKGKKSSTITIGPYPTYDLMADGPFNAVQAANEKLREIKDGKDPNAEKRESRERARGNPTLDDLFMDFIEAYSNKPKASPKENTLRVIKKARNRFLTDEVRQQLKNKEFEIDHMPKASGLLEKNASDIKASDLLKVFNKIARDEGHLTAAEQTMRWVSAVYNHRIKSDEDLEIENPYITKNPVNGLRKQFRSRSELRIDTKDKRHPIDNTEKGLGAVWKALWNAAPNHRLGADFILVNLLVGSRKSEPAKLVWGSKISEAERKNTKGYSYVDLDNKTLCFKDTKNRANLELPLGSVLFAILQDRFEHSGDNLYVFPPYRPNKTRKIPHYTDNKTFLNLIPLLIFVNELPLVCGSNV